MNVEIKVLKNHLRRKGPMSNKKFNKNVKRSDIQQWQNDQEVLTRLRQEMKQCSINCKKSLLLTKIVCEGCFKKTMNQSGSVMVYQISNKIY